MDLNKNHGNTNSNVTSTRVHLQEIHSSVLFLGDCDLLIEEQLSIKRLKNFLLEEEALLLKKSELSGLIKEMVITTSSLIKQ